MKILLFGCGSLGWRYLEGIKLARNFVTDVHIYDKNYSRTLETEFKFKDHLKITAHEFMSNIPADFNLMIMATTAYNRGTTAQELFKNRNFKYVIFEKLLAQNSVELNKIRKLTDQRSLCYVNTPRRSFPIYKRLKTLLTQDEIFLVERLGGRWGMLGNSIHYVDLVAWLSQKKPKYCEYQISSNQIYQTGRKGFIEADGNMSIHYVKDLKLLLSSDVQTQSEGLFLTLKSGSVIKVSEKEQSICFNGELYDGFTRITHELLVQKNVQAIAEDNNLELAPISESIEYHTCILQELHQDVT